MALAAALAWPAPISQLGAEELTSDLWIGWNAPPADGVDVVVHYHGYGPERLRLADKVALSGLDLTGRVRPTLALLPRGQWSGGLVQHFPHLANGGQDELVAHVLVRFGIARAGRLIVTATSGGGRWAIEAGLTARRLPDELHLFDALYRDPSAALRPWLARRSAETALRVFYRAGSPTEQPSRAVAALLGASDRRHRVEATPLAHDQVAAVLGPILLADAGADQPSR